MSDVPGKARTPPGVEPLEAAIDALESLIDETAQAAGEARLPVLNDAVDDADDVFEDDPGAEADEAPESEARERIATLVGELESLVSEGLPQAARTGAPPPAMDKTYEPQAIESHWYRRWESAGLFRAQGQGPAYCIMLPPPNVTGSLHMGHAFNNTIMDGLIRHHRMRGDATLWQCGTDHAGIATQMVVERQLAQQQVSRHDLGREGFVARVWEWKEQSGSTITRQLRRLGTSMDWDRERFTLDDGLSRAVTEVFVRLHEDGLIYRGQRLVNWDPVLHTAISDLEVVSEEESGHMWHIRYPLADGDGHVVVATTRPETMLGDSAVAVHPQDARCAALVGRRLVLPLTGRTIPVIADDYVDPAFGSGCVKITPAHDFNDYAVWQRHREQPAFTAQPHGGLINILTPDAALDAGVPAPYRGLDRYAARKRIVADLESAGLLERVQPHKLMVPRGDRSGAVVEPYLTDQWYVRAAPLAAPAIAAVEDGRIRFVPENWSKTYFEWMRNIEDWCISRQLWWGHRIPAWYDEVGNVYVGRDEAQVRVKHGLAQDLRLRQDEDVLDTWFSSALWPFSTLGWPERTPELAAFYPTSVLVTGFDIIFFWVARMAMMGLHFMGEVPFREVYVHGLVRDHEGQKMSKSKGNVLDPIDLIDGIDLDALVAKRTTGLLRPQDAARIEQSTRRQFPDGIPAHGTDALRYTFASLASLGRNINFDLGRIEGYRNFCNKLWNASRFVLMATEGVAAAAAAPAPGVGERWIRSRLQDCIAQVDEGYAQYRFDQIAHAIYEFVWGEYCDWYLEYAKTVLNDADASPGARAATRATLLDVLETVLRLAHPLMPFITEEIWQRVAPLAGRAGPSVSVAPWPALEPDARDREATAEFDWLRECILGVRRIRAEMDIAPGRPLPLSVTGGSAGEQAFLDRHRGALMALARLSGITRLAAGAEAPQSATALAGATTLLVPLADLIDRNAELERLARGIDRRRQELARVQGKLANASFVERAPAEVVAKERARLAGIESAIATLEEQRQRIASLA